MAGPAHNRRIFLFVAALLLLGAAFLRFHQIDRRPFHADEAVQAYQTWQLLRGEGYTYDPVDKHGPFLYYAAAGLAKICGWSPNSLNETRLRSFTLLAGLGTMVLLLANARRLGAATVLIAAALLAVAPLAVIYATYFVQEAWFCFLTWALFFAVMRWSDKPTFAGAMFVGALAGLMQATKETSVLHFAALGAALLAVRWSALTPTRLARADQISSRLPEGPSPDGPRPVGRRALQEKFNHALVALLCFLFIYVLFYSAFFTRWAGVIDGLRAYFNYADRASGSAHDQPWIYYFSMLWPHSTGGVRWGEPVLLFAALLGTGFAFTARASAAHRALAVFTLGLLLLYSVIPYKMPWLLLTTYVGVVLLAGLGAVQAGSGLPANLARFAPAVIAVVLVLTGAGRNFYALGRYANDDRNPYVYQPTSTDLNRLLTQVAAMPADRKIAVVSPDHAWPLPWYWRERKSIGYFFQPPANLGAYDFVLFDSRLDSPLPESFVAYGLRPNVVLWSSSP